MKYLILILTAIISFTAFADEHPAEEIKAYDFLRSKPNLISYSDESFSNPTVIDFKGNQVNKVVVNDVDNLIIRFVGIPSAKVGAALVGVKKRNTYEIFITFDGGETQNCYVTFEDDNDPKFSRCSKY